MWVLIYSHEVSGDPVGAAGDGFELHPLQVHVFGQTPLQHVSCQPTFAERKHQNEIKSTASVAEGKYVHEFFAEYRAGGVTQAGWISPSSL